MADAGLPVWLPAMFPAESWSKEMYDQLYSEVFCRDFKSTPLLYRGHGVWYFPESALGRELIFVHLTSRNNDATGEREIRLERCARLPWVRPMIEHPDDSAILSWDHEEDDETVNTYVWLHAHDYIIVLRRLDDESRRLITAYCLEFGHERRKMQKKYERRIQS